MSQLVLSDLATLRATLGRAAHKDEPFQITPSLLAELEADEDLCQNIYNCGMFGAR